MTNLPLKGAPTSPAPPNAFPWVVYYFESKLIIGPQDAQGFYDASLDRFRGFIVFIR